MKASTQYHITHLFPVSVPVPVPPSANTPLRPNHQQECIPVRCVPPVSGAISLGGVFLEGSVCHPPADTQTPVKMLPFPKLCLGAVKILLVCLLIGVTDTSIVRPLVLFKSFSIQCKFLFCGTCELTFSKSSLSTQATLKSGLISSASPMRAPLLAEM